MASVSNAVETTAIDLAGLRDRIGEVIGPRDPGRDEGRAIWNGAIDLRPGAIARCSSVAEVVEAVRFARERCLLVSVRGGGDGVGGFAVCDEGLVIDLSPLKRISVVPAAPAAAPDPPHALTFYPTSTTEENRVCIAYATQRQRRSNDTEAW